jgi:hypothetical protein
MNMTTDNLNITNFFYTHDLGLATAISLFYPLELIDRTQNPTKAQFVFKREEGLDKIVEAYWRGQLSGNLLAYFNQLKIVKSRLYEGRQK